MRASILVLCLASASVAFAGDRPSIKAESAIVMEAETGKVLFSKNADAKKYPASTTKIMTALLLLEKAGPEELIKAPSDVEKVTGSSLHLKPGEAISASDMLYALMIRSANDGAYATAMHIAGSVPKFAALMNQRAKDIGCKNTHFTNPHGLKDPKHVTTARDLALMAREAMKYSEFAQAAQTKSWTISRSMNPEDIALFTKNKWLKEEPTADGIKTGYTNPAGYCFVGSATRDGYRIITVVLKSTSKDWPGDTRTLMDWAFENHERPLVHYEGQPVKNLPVQGGAASEVAVGPDRNVYVTVPRGKASDVQFIVEAKPLEAPVQQGQRVGDIVVVDPSGHRQRFAAIAVQEVPKQSLAAAASTGWTFPLVGGTLLVGAIWMRGKTRRRLRFYDRSSRQRA